MPELNGPRGISAGIALFIGIIAVSSGSVFIRFAQTAAPSLTIAAYRLGLAALILLPFVWLRHRRELAGLALADWLWALASGVFLAIHFAAWITSLEYTSVASSVALVSTSPLWVALFTWICWHEPLTPSQWSGLGLALAGSIMISLVEVGAPISIRPFFGNLLALTGALAVGAYWLIGHKLRRRISILPYVTLVYGSAALLLLATAWFTDQPLFGFTAKTYGWFLLLALLPQLVGHSSFNWALGQLPASTIAIATLGEPIGAIFLAFIFLGETPSAPKGVAASLILIGIVLALHRSPQKLKACDPANPQP